MNISIHQKLVVGGGGVGVEMFSLGFNLLLSAHEFVLWIMRWDESFIKLLFYKGGQKEKQLPTLLAGDQWFINLNHVTALSVPFLHCAQDSAGMQRAGKRAQVVSQASSWLPWMEPGSFCPQFPAQPALLQSIFTGYHVSQPRSLLQARVPYLPPAPHSSLWSNRETYIYSFILHSKASLSSI